MRKEHVQTSVSHDPSAVVRSPPIIQGSAFLPSLPDTHFPTSVKVLLQIGNSRTNTLQRAVTHKRRHKKSAILTAVQSDWSRRCYSLPPIWEKRNLSPFLSSRASAFLPPLHIHLFLISVLSSWVSSNVRGQRDAPLFWHHLHLEIHNCRVTDLPQVLWRGSVLLNRTLMRPRYENVTGTSQVVLLFFHGSSVFRRSPQFTKRFSQTVICAAPTNDNIFLLFHFW